MKRTRVAFLGSGLMSKKHGTAIASFDDAEVVAVAGRTKQSAGALAKEIGGEAYDDYDRMLDDARPDALYVCLPPGAHAGEVEKAAAKGIHVFLEKPIARTVERGTSMRDACVKAGIVTQVGYNMHYHPLVQKLKGLIDTGTAGRPTLFDAIFTSNSPHKEWWRSEALSGGQVFEQGIHLYELAMHLLGRPVRIGSFLANNCHMDMPDYEVDDTGSSAIGFASGASATIATTNCAIPNVWRLGFTLVCEKLTVFFDGLNKARFIYTGENEPRTEELEEAADSHRHQNRAFIDAVRGKREAEPTIERGLESLKLVDAALRSTREGRMIDLG